jgi:hypothetical protein
MLFVFLLVGTGVREAAPTNGTKDEGDFIQLDGLDILIAARTAGVFVRGEAMSATIRADIFHG